MFSDHNYALKTYATLDAADKIKEAQKSGAAITINKDEINELTQIYFKKDISRGDFVLKRINVALQNDKMIFYAPVSYRGIEFLLSAKGTINYDQGKVFIFVPDSFRIGKILVPNVAVFAMVK